MPKSHELYADLRRLLERDWQNVAAGVYAAPEGWSGKPLSELQKAVDFFIDLPAVEKRRHGSGRDRLLPQPESQAYPRYYLQNFHFQSDGYLSAASAERYDHQVEVLFGGGAAAMRRQGLVPLRDALLRHSSNESVAKLLDVGCGTGAFLREVKRNYPRLRVTGVDLSTPYLEVAKRRLRKWSRIELIKGAAEELPFETASFDIVTSVYLLHELPPRVRCLVAAEMRRVLKPGGMLILVDSLQTGDVPDYDGLLEFFPVAFHEPYYTGYLAEDLDRLFSPGLTRETSALAYLSKVIAYRS